MLLSTPRRTSANVESSATSQADRVATEKHSLLVSNFITISYAVSPWARSLFSVIFNRLQVILQFQRVLNNCTVIGHASDTSWLSIN